ERYDNGIQTCALPIDISKRFSRIIRKDLTFRKEFRVIFAELALFSCSYRGSCSATRVFAVHIHVTELDAQIAVIDHWLQLRQGFFSPASAERTLVIRKHHHHHGSVRGSDG